MDGHDADPTMGIAEALYGVLIAFGVTRSRLDDGSNPPFSLSDDDELRSCSSGEATEMKERPAVSEPEGRILKRVPFRSTPHAAYTAVGLLLGFGAPVGALLLRTLIDAQARAQPLLELRQNAFFYLYTFIGTSLVFGLAGFVAADRREGCGNRNTSGIE